MQESDDSQAWVEVVVTAPVALADGLAAELIAALPDASSGVQVRRGEVVFWVQPPELEDALQRTRTCLQRLADEGWQLDPSRVRAGVAAPEAQWRDAWKKFFAVTRLTRQIVVVPSWERHEPLATDIPILLDPGQAFGTGAHASTQLVLTEMQELADANHPAPARVFDLGTGSGILAIAAAKLWPDCHVVATDIDPLSMDATRDNGAQNAVDARIEASLTPLENVDERFPLVLANIQAHILRGMRDALIDRVAPGGRLLLSGILSSQITPLTEYFLEASSPLRLVAIRESELNPDWSSAHFERQATSTP